MQSLDWRPCQAVARALGYKRHPLTIHVAGSKGKGTVCALVGAALERAGFRVGVVTSPHTYHFGERLRIGMRPAGDALAPHLQRAVDVILEARRREDAVLAAATQFDAFVAAALKAAQKCDAVVVEVGLGGKRDSTNFLQAPITALVSVEREHTEVLGDSLRGIAAEKAGICTKDGVLVLGDLGRAPREKALEIARKTRRHAAGAKAGEDCTRDPGGVFSCGAGRPRRRRRFCGREPARRSPGVADRSKSITRARRVCRRRVRRRRAHGRERGGLREIRKAKGPRRRFDHSAAGGQKCGERRGGGPRAPRPNPRRLLLVRRGLRGRIKARRRL